MFHQDITPHDYEYFRNHSGAFKRMWHEQVIHGVALISFSPSRARALSLSHEVLSPYLTHSLSFPTDEKVLVSVC